MSIIPETSTWTLGATVHEYNDSKYRLGYKKQHSSFTSAKEVVPTEEYHKGSIY